jgi:hypothetical protein
MSSEKDELYATAEGVCNVLVELEALQDVRNDASDEYDNAYYAYEDAKGTIKWSIIKGVIALILTIVFNTLDIRGFFSILQVITGAYFLWCAVKTVFCIIKLPFKKTAVNSTFKELELAEQDVEICFNKYPKEFADANRLFLSGGYYIWSEYLKFGLECLRSGRADNYKEMMNLIDDKKHKEYMEEQARQQTEYASDAAYYSRQAAYDASAARTAAESARSKLSSL